MYVWTYICIYDGMGTLELLKNQQQINFFRKTGQMNCAEEDSWMTAMDYNRKVLCFHYYTYIFQTPINNNVHLVIL